VRTQACQRTAPLPAYSVMWTAFKADGTSAWKTENKLQSWRLCHQIKSSLPSDAESLNENHNVDVRGWMLDLCCGCVISDVSVDVIVVVCIVIVDVINTFPHLVLHNVTATVIIGSRPSDHYFRSVCLSVCLCRLFFSAVFDPISIKLGHMLLLYVWSSCVP